MCRYITNIGNKLMGVLSPLVCGYTCVMFSGTQALATTNQKLVQISGYAWIWWHCPGVSDDKASACNAGNLGSISGSGRSPGGGNGNPLQYSNLENPMDRRAWQATVHRVTKSWTWLSHMKWLSMHAVALPLTGVKNMHVIYFLRMAICCKASAWEGQED